MNRNKIIITVSLIALFLTGCVDLVEDPVGIVAPEAFFKTEADVIGAINGIYASVSISTHVDLLKDLISDECDVSVLNFRPYRYFLNEYTFGPSDLYAGDSDGGTWTGSYASINTCNMALKYIPIVTMSDEKKNKYMAEARFIRALTYFHLVRQHGDIPLLLSLLGSPREARELTRTPAEEVYVEIINDCKFAIDY